MGKEKFVYNPSTLRYEKVQMPLSKRLLRMGAIASVVAAYSALLMFLAPNLTISGSLLQKDKELAIIRAKYEEMNAHLDKMEAALNNVQERDMALYRHILQMDPMDEDVWKGGKGGSEKHPELDNLPESELLQRAADKLAEMRHRLALSLQSQEEIFSKAKSQERELTSRPSIRPIGKLDRNIKLLSGFGYRLHPVYKIRKMHTGIDFGAPIGTPIYATASGKVIRVEFKATGYGKSVVIDHGHGYQTLYGHMSVIDVKVGQEVRLGEKIGKVGNTGTSTAPHVHYEVIHKGERVNPLPFCLDNLSPAEYKEFVAQASAENIALSIVE